MPCKPELEKLRDADPVGFRAKRDAATAAPLEPFDPKPIEDQYTGTAFVVWLSENKVLGFTSVTEVQCTKLELGHWGWHNESVIEADEWLNAAQAEHSEEHVYDSARLLYVIRNGNIEALAVSDITV